MGYLKDTIKGTSWLGSLRVASRLIAFVKLAVLARLLVPEQFGVYGIAALELAFLENITETGINVYLIQIKADLEKYVDSAWFVSIARGILMSTLILLSAPYVANFFSTPESENILKLIALVPFLRGFINPSIVRFEKELTFNKEFYLRFSIFFIDACVSIATALATKSASSLVWGLAAGALLELTISHLLIIPKPRLAYESGKVKEIINRGKWVTAFGIFDYLFRQGDDIVVGKLLNAESLGIYQAAYKISILPITEIAAVVNQVIFPVYSKISDDLERLKSAYIKTNLVVLGLTFPVGLLLCIFPKQIVLILLGDKWLEAASVIRVLSFFGVISALTGPSTSLFLALKKQEYVTIFTLVSILGLAVTIVPLVKTYGIVGAGVSAMIGLILSLPFIAYYSLKILKNENV